MKLVTRLLSWVGFIPIRELIQLEALYSRTTRSLDSKLEAAERRGEEARRITRETLARLSVTDAIIEDLRRRLADATRESRPLNLEGETGCPGCAKFRRRIKRFFEHKALVKAAYVEQVFMCSHGQVDRRAPVDAEGYLIQDDEKITTYGELRDSEISRAIAQLTDVAKTEENKP